MGDSDYGTPGAMDGGSSVVDVDGKSDRGSPWRGIGETGALHEAFRLSDFGGALLVG